MLPQTPFRGATLSVRIESLSPDPESPASSFESPVRNIESRLRNFFHVARNLDRVTGDVSATHYILPATHSASIGPWNADSRRLPMRGTASVNMPGLPADGVSGGNAGEDI